MVFHAFQTQDLVFGGTALALGGLQFVLSGGEFTRRRFFLTFRRFQFFMHSGGLPVQLFQLGRTAQNACTAGRGTTCHGAATVDDLAVQRHDAESVAVLSRHGDATVHILHDDRTAQEGVENILISSIELHQTGGNANESELVLYPAFPQLITADGSERQERGTSAVPLLQEIDSTLGVLFPVHHDVLQSRAQSDLNSKGIFLVGLHQIGNRSVDTPQTSFGLHHDFYCLGEAFVLLLHFRQQPDAVIQRTHVHGQLDPLLGRGGSFLASFLHAEIVARDDIADRSGLILCVFQRTPVGLGLLFRFRQLLPGGGHISFHRSLTGG